MKRLRYFVAIAVAIVGLNIGLSAQPAGAMCVAESPARRTQLSSRPVPVESGEVRDLLPGLIAASSLRAAARYAALGGRTATQGRTRARCFAKNAVVLATMSSRFSTGTWPAPQFEVSCRGTSPRQAPVSVPRPSMNVLEALEVALGAALDEAERIGRLLDEPLGLVVDLQHDLRLVVVEPVERHDPGVVRTGRCSSTRPARRASAR